MRLRFPSRCFVRLSALLLTAIGSTSTATAQCATQWMSAGGAPTTNGVVLATTMWDPDGAGPAGPLLVVAGSFTIAGTAQGNNIATWDPATGAWAPLSSGMTGSLAKIMALTVMPNGDLVAGGFFTAAGGVPATNIARWNGTTWAPLGTGVTGGPSVSVKALATLPNGHLVVGGFFTTAGGTTVNSIARWDGTAWSAMGTGMNGGVDAVASLPNGDVVAGGAFSTAGGLPANRIARWNGTNWSALGGVTGVAPSVSTLITLANGDLVAGGSFTNAGGVPANSIARWNGTTWSAFGAGTNAAVTALTVLPNGDLVAGGAFTTAGGLPANRVARWDGAAWSALGTGLNGGSPTPATTTLTTLPNGDLVAAGPLARWNGANWSLLGPGFDNYPAAMATLANGDLVLGGVFTVPANRIARWDGASWSALGSGMDGGVMALATLANGDLIAGGDFLTAGGATVNRIARWNGTSWSALGTGISNTPFPGSAIVYAVATLPNGVVVAGGSFSTVGGAAGDRIARWNGSTWSTLGGGTNGPVTALATLPNGHLVAGGFFTSAGGVPANSIARWNGANWSPLGTGLDGSVTALTTLPNGDLVAAGAFTTAGGVPAKGVARWNGTSWAPLGAGIDGSSPPFVSAVRCLATLPNGDVVAGGSFATSGGTPVANIARWNGTTWSAIGTGTDDSVEELMMLPSGDLAVGGLFGTVGGLVSPFHARVITTCPATAAPFGNGCPSSGGSNTLVADTPPWVDATFRATGSGLPSLAIVLELTSLTSVPQGVAPLTLVFPQAGPGCDILTLPDILVPVVTTTGTAQSSLFLPNVPPLVGVTFYHQMVPIEVDSQGAWVAVTATNALQLTAGAF